jgi:hypothetical protein
MHEKRHAINEIISKSRIKNNDIIERMLSKVN